MCSLSYQELNFAFLFVLMFHILYNIQNEHCTSVYNTSRLRSFQTHKTLLKSQETVSLYLSWLFCSWGVNCGEELPGVYTDVQYFLITDNWLCKVFNYKCSDQVHRGNASPYTVSKENVCLSCLTLLDWLAQ
jgi:hypothetical protein